MLPPSIKSRDNLLWGALLGIITPLMGALIVYILFGLMVDLDIMNPTDMSIDGRRMRTIILLGICTNIFWIRLYNTRFTSQTNRGVMIITMLLCLLWFLYYSSSLYQDI